VTTHATPSDGAAKRRVYDTVSPQTVDGPGYYRIDEYLSLKYVGIRV
jgi:hypothetical protein